MTLTSNLNRKPSCCYLDWLVCPKRNSYKSSFTSLSGLVYLQFKKSFSAAACWRASADKCAKVILVNRCRFRSFKCSRASRLSQHAWCLQAALLLCMSQIKFGLTNPIWTSTDGPSWRRCWEESSFQVARRRTADWRSTASNNDWLSCTYVLGLSLCHSKTGIMLLFYILCIFPGHYKSGHIAITLNVKMSER